ncbi:unnamed protein product [Pleuronectes platessa]|uniref:Uncharacterized protein n=1 Tax=Pleuronectes platessa TaxID=8262 RepID=A0A9N7V115_PLEPL|nr:unnamed protein product [Pleuronectes platessa]
MGHVSGELPFVKTFLKFDACLLGALRQLCAVEEQCVCVSSGGPGLRGGFEWPLHDQPERHSGSHGVFVSSSNLASSSLPSIHLPQCFLSSLCACCSLSRYNGARPRWLREQTLSHLDH